MLFLHVALSNTQQLHRSGAFKLSTRDKTHFYMHFFCRMPRNPKLLIAKRIILLEGLA